MYMSYKDRSMKIVNEKPVKCKEGEQCAQVLVYRDDQTTLQNLSYGGADFERVGTMLTSLSNKYDMSLFANGFNVRADFVYADDDNQLKAFIAPKADDKPSDDISF